MESTAVYQTLNTSNHFELTALVLKIKDTIMKKLTNISPFLLLLVPVFVMMLVVFTAGNNIRNEEIAMKSSSKGAVAKLDSAFRK